MPLGIWNRTHTYTNFPRKSDPFIYQPTQFWSKFWQSYLPPFFLFIVFCFSNFLLRFKPILAQSSEKIEKSTHSYTKFCIDMGSLIYWYTRRSYPCWWHILVGSFLLSNNSTPPPGPTSVKVKLSFRPI